MLKEDKFSFPDNEIKLFTEALNLSLPENRHILLANGFSIAGSENFNYRHLYANSEIREDVRKLFDNLKTYDFEIVILRVEHALQVAEILNPENASVFQYKNVIAHLKNCFARTITTIHPAYNAVFSGSHGLTLKLRSCGKFLSLFKNIFTTNYDLLLYWTVLDKSYLISKNDGFGRAEDTSTLQWQNLQGQSIFYLHGMLALIESKEGLVKRTQTYKQSLLEKIQADIKEGNYPLMVLEGTSQSKFSKIQSHPYLLYAYNELKKLTGDLFIFGHSLDDSDDHIVKAIDKSTLKNIFISVYAEEISERAAFIKRAETKFKNKEVYFFNAESAEVWT